MFTMGTDFYCGQKSGFTYCNPKNAQTLAAIKYMQTQLLILVNGVADAAAARGVPLTGLAALKVNPGIISTSGAPDGSVGNGTAILVAWAIQSANDLSPAPADILALARQIGTKEAPSHVFAPITAAAQEIGDYLASVNANFASLYEDYILRNNYQGQGANTPIEAGAVEVVKEAVERGNLWLWVIAGVAVVGLGAVFALKKRKTEKKKRVTRITGRTWVKGHSRYSYA